MSDDLVKDFWVRWDGYILPRGEVAVSDADLKLFLAAVTKQFGRHDSLTQPAVFCPGDGSIALTAVVRASSDGVAIDRARLAFDEAIRRAGGGSALPEAEDASWGAFHLDRTELSVRELAKT